MRLPGIGSPVTGMSILVVFLLLFTSSILAEPVPKAQPVAAAASTTATESSNAKTSASSTSKVASTTASTTASATSKTSTGQSSSTDSMPNVSSTTKSSSSSGTASSSSGTSSGATTSDSMPTISSAESSSYPTYSIGVPDTSDAPYMQSSSLPDGTIFIAVGAALGFFGVAVVAWRGLVAYSLHRSVKRAAMAQSYGEQKARLLKKAGLYSHGAGSTMSLNPIPYSKPRRERRHHHRKSSHRRSRGGAEDDSATPATSLFFSPTANTLHNPNNTSSGYLPAGLYSPANIGTGDPRSSFLGPQAQGYSHARTSGVSPPGSPNLSSFGGDGARDDSSNIANPATPFEGRTPSAYLEDLFEHHVPGHNNDR